MAPIRLHLSALVAAGIGGCATYDTAGTEPVPIGNDVYSIGSGTAGIDDASYQRAIRFCFDQGKQLLRLDGQPNLPQSGGSSVQFRCVGPGETGWKEPVG
jgi:hypothetical protein